MWTKQFLFVVVILGMYQVISQDIYVAEVMVESNVTLSSENILASWSKDTTITTNTTIISSELVAECLVIGEDYSCNCSTGYAWSNEVCYSYGCCNESTCKQNVSQATSICVPKTNGNKVFSYTNDVHPTIPDYNEFKVKVNVDVNSSRLQELLDSLLPSSPILVSTQGMVNIKGPSGTVKYESDQTFDCTFEYESDSASWNQTKGTQNLGVREGRLTEIKNCPTTVDYKSCSEMTLKKVTGAWEGTYMCIFTIGKISHTASTALDVDLLPDEITMTYKPLIADCSEKPETPAKVTVTAMIPETEGTYNLTWEENGKKSVQANPNMSQKSCDLETEDGVEWPKTPPETIVQNPKCPAGRIGFRSRTCNANAKWEDVISKCISEELGKVANAAENFRNGLGATPEVAKSIFEGIKNTSSSASSGSSVDDLADIGASINIFGVMKDASKNIELGEEMLNDVVEAASNMVNASWDSLPEENILEMSSQYLTNVEGLVKEIKINNSEGLNSSNLELRFCSSDDCSISIFGVGVNMNKTNGTVKTMAVKNLMNKLKSREFPKKNHSSLVLSATLVDSNDSDINIQIFFPDEQPSATERICVFWDNDAKDWSSEGCVANITDDNQTLCICNHLTAFSVLMAKSANVSSESLEMITYIGLGVSIFSLLIFLFVESLVWSAVTKSNLSHFRHTAVVNIAVFRLLADCSFLASIEPDSLSEDMCLGLTVCKHLFYLAMFCWMLCLSVMLVHQLIFVFSPVRKRVFMYLSSIVGYVLPMALVASSYVYYRYTEQEYFDKKSCWLRYDRLLEGSIHAFLLPVGTIVLSNLFSMVVVIVTLVKTSVPDSSKADDKDTAKSILKVVVFLTPVFGVTWIFGFVFLILDYDNPLHTPVNYIFTILNSFQGLFILLTGLAEQKVRQELVKIVMAKTGRDTDSIKKFTNSSATTYTKDK
ncbi:PREDICTED: adhesion G protein-coupled receptor F5-like [Cyprinodon variegatus]|uniref:adhesion G protein-coupled receptor F5-like n=1 Tax=Cyprinodon variegatus TaxID=28743 RepID=UPI0007426A00|nr:PREDICTED: adhesion G protein-coupled receptor F5-like [Cyprinodon variegatus]